MGHFIYQLPLTNHRLTSLSIVGLPYVSSISDANMTIETVSASGSIGHRIFQAYFLPILVIFKSLKIHFSKPCPAYHNFFILKKHYSFVWIVAYFETKSEYIDQKKYLPPEWWRSRATPGKGSWWCELPNDRWRHWRELFANHTDRESLESKHQHSKSESQSTKW
jgi:hypothetical protein